MESRGILSLRHRIEEGLPGARGRGSRWLHASRVALYRSAGAVGAGAALLYATTLSFGFIYDDYWTVVNNRFLTLPWRSLARVELSGKAIELGIPDATRPVMTWSGWLDRMLFDLEPVGHHLQSVLLYAALCAAVVALAFGLLRSAFAAVAAGICFAVMPVHAEAVAAINYREDLLSGLGIAAASAGLFWPGAARWPWQAAVVVGGWLFALLSKESAAAWPLMLLGLAIDPALRRRMRAGLSRCWVALAVTTVLWANWRLGVSALGEQIPTASYSGWGERGLRFGRFAVQSVGASLGLHRVCPQHAAQPSASWGWLVGLAVLVAGCAWWQRRSPVARRACALASLAVTGSVAVSPLLGPANERADRYWMLPSMGGALLAAYLLHRLSRRSRLGAAGLLGGVAVAGSLASYRAAQTWGDEVSLWTRASQCAPSSPRAWTALARLSRLTGDPERARRAASRALELDASYFPARLERANQELWLGHREAAQRSLAAIAASAPQRRSAIDGAERCAKLPSDEAAAACAQKRVPRGMVVGEEGRLRTYLDQALKL